MTQMLHIAPEPQLEERFRKVPALSYVSADLDDSRAMVKADLSDLPFADGSFDCVFCSHVLEHVPDDHKALCELRRVLRPSGWALIMVPSFEGPTLEDPSLATPLERLRRYGQSDHVRRYGTDFPDRLGQAGFCVEEVTTQCMVSTEEAVHLGIEGRTLFFCRLLTAA